MVSNLEYEVSKIAYGELEGTIECMLKMGATGADLDYVIFNNESDLFTKADAYFPTSGREEFQTRLGPTSRPVTHISPPDERGERRSVPGDLGSGKSRRALRRLAETEGWETDPSTGLLTSPTGETVKPGYGRRFKNWAKESMRGYQDWAEERDQNKRDFALWNALSDQEKHDARRRAIDRRSAPASTDEDDKTDEAEIQEQQGVPFTIDPSTAVEMVEPPAHGYWVGDPLEATPDVDEEELARRTTYDPAIEAAVDSMRESSPQGHYIFGESFARDPENMSPELEEGQHGPGHAGRGPVWDDESKSFVFDETGAPHIYRRGASHGRKDWWSTGARTRPTGIEGARTGHYKADQRTGIVPVQELLQYTVMENPGLFEKFQETGNLSALLNAAEKTKKKYGEHFAGINTGHIMRSLAKTPQIEYGPREDIEGDPGYMATMFGEGVAGPEDWQKIQDESDYYRGLRSASAKAGYGSGVRAGQPVIEQQPPNPNDMGAGDPPVVEPPAGPPAGPPPGPSENQTIQDPPQMGRGRTPQSAFDKITSSDPLQSAWDHLTLLKEGDE